MKLERLSKDRDGAVGGKTLLFLVVILAVVLLYLSGTVTFSLPTTSVTDEYSEAVNRGASDVGIRVPIEVKVSLVQVAGTSTATIDLNIKHKHESLGSDGNYVPDPTLVDDTNFDTRVGSVGDSSTIYCVNGNSFTASDITFNSSVTSLASVNYGNSQDNYKVWTTSTTHTPPTSPGTTSDDNSALLVQTVWTHYRKGTSEQLSQDTVTWVVYTKLADYDEDDSYTSTYTYYVYVPFNDYAVVEDIKVDIFGFASHCDIEWASVETVTHTFWEFPIINAMFGKYLDSGGVGQIKVVMSEDTLLATRIEYNWESPLERYSINNNNEYGSHSYTYKVR